MTDERPIIWSCGGGRQSAAIAILIKEGKLPTPERAVMADTGREKASTWRYVDEYIRPALLTRGLNVEIVPHSYASVDLYSKADSLLIPAFTKNGEGQMRTFCSGEWKRDPIFRWLREPERGYGPANPIIQWLGFSTNEKRRCKPAARKWAECHWPLIMGYDVHMSAADCVHLITAYGWPDCEQSCCWMCPFQTNAQWRRQRDNEPADQAKAIALDRRIIEADERGGAFLHQSGVPLSEVNLDEDDNRQDSLFGRDEVCESGLCWT